MENPIIVVQRGLADGQSRIELSQRCDEEASQRLFFENRPMAVQVSELEHLLQQFVVIEQLVELLLRDSFFILLSREPLLLLFLFQLFFARLIAF